MPNRLLTKLTPVQLNILWKYSFHCLDHENWQGTRQYEYMLHVAVSTYMYLDKPTDQCIVNRARGSGEITP